MWELDCEESWAPKNGCFWTVVLEKTLENALDCKEIQPVHSEGDQPWDFFGRTDAKAETPVFWPTHVKNWLWKRLWCWEGLGAAGEGDDRGWGGWMASPTWWMWVWVNSGSLWWTGRSGMLTSIGWQRVGHDWETEMNLTKANKISISLSLCLFLSPLSCSTSYCHSFILKFYHRQDILTPIDNWDTGFFLHFLCRNM